MKKKKHFQKLEKCAIMMKITLLKGNFDCFIQKNEITNIAFLWLKTQKLS